ncbi:DsbA family protein [Facklamia sp. 7083-14-GEN3]|uniref:DsbA family protein n=1 Tax=Facklamia sp. 7083-14-GEN3 TaxID=2973478 RepID=UPI00215CFE2C|nr:DsbA family protein [Facklamia sp. 7083-14-GEN3]MCR8969437.1 DsbA family protein [Facklamia sp. 7083-14-GEN3]
MENYLIDYHLNGHKKYFDFYLFVNPLGRKCYYSEQEINKASKIISSKTDINILCIHNEKILNEFMQRLGIHNPSLKVRNDLYCKLYKAALAVKAAHFQGKRKGRHFLKELQRNIYSDLSILNEDLIMEVAVNNGLDPDLFYDDFHSDYTKELYFNDLKIAEAMGVESTPSLVIFDSSSDDEGILLEDHVTYDSVLEHLDSLFKSQCQEYSDDSGPHLNIIK